MYRMHLCCSDDVLSFFSLPFRNLVRALILLLRIRWIASSRLDQCVAVVRCFSRLCFLVRLPPPPPSTASIFLFDSGGDHPNLSLAELLLGAVLFEDYNHEVKVLRKSYKTDSVVRAARWL